MFQGTFYMTRTGDLHGCGETGDVANLVYPCQRTPPRALERTRVRPRFPHPNTELNFRVHAPQLYFDYTKLVEEYNVKTPNAKELAKNLSGGNQQKVVVGRELDRAPKLLIAVHPSRGLDIGATKFIQQQMVKQRDGGTAVMMVSTELDELIELSDRILVMYEGENMGVLDQKDATRERLGSLMAGIREEEDAV